MEPPRPSPFRRPVGVLRPLRAILIAALALAAAGIAWSVRRAPVTRSAPSVALGVPEWPASPAFGVREWTAIQSSRPAAAGPIPEASNARYRLAGTFIAPEGSLGGVTGTLCRAIIDDLQTKQQYLLAEGEISGELKMLRIRSDRVIVEIAGRTEELFLSFGAAAVPTPSSANASSFTEVPPEKVLEESAYGKRVGETRWVMNRDSLLGYYREMLDHPERIAKLYDTFQPDYVKGKIEGYRVKVEGEGDFLKAVGLREGDVVRMVNSMRMSSQSRAEFWMGEFVKDRMGAAVLDIEREGKPEKLVYLFR